MSAACKLALECTRQICQVFLHIFLLTNSCTNRLEKQTISVANSLYERSKEESVLTEAYPGTESLAQVRASLA